MSFDKIYKYRIEDIIDNINLYYFDLNRILNNTMYTDIDCSKKYWQYFKNLKSINITEIQVPISNVEMIDNRLYVYYLSIKGNFTFKNEDFVEFNVLLQKDNYLYWNEIGIYYLNSHQPFTLTLTDPTWDDYTSTFLYIFKSEYKLYLDKTFEDYYNLLNN